jgi:hypothetical protein
VVLSGLGFGFQLGSWPVWTFLAAIGIYLAWVVLYAEITVQASRIRGRVRTATSPAPMPKPSQEERPA